MGLLDFLQSLLCPKPKDTLQIPELPISPEEIKKYPIISPIGVLKKYNFTNVTIADAKYVALPKNLWENILTKIYNNVNPLLSYHLNSWDCDDYATLYASLVALTWYLNLRTAKYQLAFGISWSNVHAFNIFIDDNTKVWIYEPQTNRVVGELDKITEDMYKPIRIWFMG